MTDKIKELTPEDHKRIPEIREEFIKIGTATGPANREETEAAVRQAYEQVGLKAPEKILWFRSPREGAIAKAIFVDTGITDYDEIMARIAAKNYKVDSSALQNAIYGQHDVAWLALYSFFDEKMPGLEKIRPLITIAKNIGWWWAHETVAFLTERPVSISLNNNNQLHCATGPAIAYADGFAVYAWNGLRIPKHFIEERDKITFKMINNETNAEYKRVLVDLYGRDKYLKDIDAKLIDESKYGKLWKGNDGGSEPYMIVEVENSTPEWFDGKFQKRKFFLRVPPAVKTAHEAVAWTFFKTPKTYAPIKET